MKWVIKNELARASRPGYPCESVSRKKVEDWISKTKQLGIKTILCLLDPDQLKYYTKHLGHAGGLLEVYKANGFEVIHVPVRDYENPPVPAAVLTHIEKIYHAAQKPVLIHCSAGVDRTGAAVDFLVRKESVSL